MRKEYPSISLGTVYRNLATLIDQGLVFKFSHADGQWRYDGRVGEHHHFTCTKCGMVRDIEGCVDFSEMEKSLHHQGCTPTHYSVICSGVCSRCAQHADSLHSKKQELN